MTLRVGRGDNSSEKVYTEYVKVAYPDQVNAEFEADKLNAYNTDDVTFTDMSTGFPTSWDWTFATADGIIVKSTEQNPVLKFAPGLYTVTLTASNPLATSTVTKADYLNVIDHDAVAAGFAASTPLLILAGQSVTFEDQSMGRPEQWNWTFDGADTPSSTDRNPTVRYSNPGRFKVTLKASNEVNSSTLEKDGYVMVLPAAGLSMWFPFDGNLNDNGPNNIHIEEYTSDASKWTLRLDSPSRHEGSYSVKCAGVTKTNTVAGRHATIYDDCMGTNRGYFCFPSRHVQPRTTCEYFAQRCVGTKSGMVSLQQKSILIRRICTLVRNKQRMDPQYTGPLIV